ncbi:MAG TPA: glycosyltransferase family 4 protein [Puia sp.]|nr:glycosyltransferase family 4 protein [Puia sp.]
MSGKKNILVLVDWFAPGYKAGGPIQSCVNFAFAMKDEFTIRVLTTDTDHGEKQAYPGIPADRWITNLHPDIQVLYLKKASLGRSQIRQQLTAIGADYVYLNHLFSPLFVVYPLWLKYTGRLSSEIVLCPRGALFDSALSVKPWKKMPFLKLFRWLGIHRMILFHATNEREKEAISNYFPGSRIVIADNLPNGNQPPFLSCPKAKGLVKCIFISRIVPIKNLLFFLKALKNVVSEVEFSIIGPVEDAAYWNECKEEIGRANANVRISYLGPKRNDELPGILQEHHLYVLPTAGENFGHSIFEALMAGRPVLISDQTPWLGLPDDRAGWDLPLQDPGAYARVVEEVAGWDQDRFDDWARCAWEYARRFIENPELHRQYLNLFV